MPAIKPLPERLVMELTTHRTLALRDALAGNPHVAMTALLHKLVIDTFQRTGTSGGCLEASIRHVDIHPGQDAGLPKVLLDAANRHGGHGKRTI